MTDNAKNNNLTVYYDGACALCSLEIGHYETRTGAETIDFVNVAEDATPPGLTRAQALARFHVRRADGTILSGARAFIAVWDSLPNWRWAARLARVPGVPWAMEILYRLFLTVRPGLSRLAKRLGAKPRTHV